MADLVKFSVHTSGSTMAKSMTDARGFKIYMDEPPDLGCDDRAPSPLEFILAAHGGCLNYMCFFIADQLGMDLKGVEVDIEAGLDPGKFAGTDRTVRAGYQDYTVKIKLNSSASPEEIAKLQSEVEARCPVSDNITNASPVKIEMSTG